MLKWSGYTEVLSLEWYGKAHLSFPPCSFFISLQATLVHKQVKFVFFRTFVFYTLRYKSSYTVSYNYRHLYMVLHLQQDLTSLFSIFLEKKMFPVVFCFRVLIARDSLCNSRTTFETWGLERHCKSPLLSRTTSQFSRTS